MCMNTEGEKLMNLIKTSHNGNPVVLHKCVLMTCLHNSVDGECGEAVWVALLTERQNKEYNNERYK